MHEKRTPGQERERYKEIGKRLFARRKELQYTQVLGVSAGFYGMLERGEKAPSIDRLIRIYEELGTDITYLLTGDTKSGTMIDYLMSCPREKRHDLEQVVKYALNLANNGKKESDDQ